jgi:hypothetical protein
MNEVIRPVYGFLIPSKSGGKKGNLGVHTQKIEGHDIAKIIANIIAIPLKNGQIMAKLAMESFKKYKSDFYQAFAKQFEEMQ